MIKMDYIGRGCKGYKLDGVGPIETDPPPNSSNTVIYFF